MIMYLANPGIAGAPAIGDRRNFSLPATNGKQPLEPRMPEAPPMAGPLAVDATSTHEQTGWRYTPLLCSLSSSGCSGLIWLPHLGQRGINALAASMFAFA